MLSQTTGVGQTHEPAAHTDDLAEVLVQRQAQRARAAKEIKQCLQRDSGPTERRKRCSVHAAWRFRQPIGSNVRKEGSDEIKARSPITHRRRRRRR